MTTLLAPVRIGASITASLLEQTAAVLRSIAGDGRTPDATEPAAPAEPQRPAEPATHGTTPAAGTRTRIANPKAARKVRSRGA